MFAPLDLWGGMITYASVPSQRLFRYFIGLLKNPLMRWSAAWINPEVG
jgi:hypothetical protein